MLEGIWHITKIIDFYYLRFTKTFIKVSKLEFKARIAFYINLDNDIFCTFHHLLNRLSSNSKDYCFF